MSERGGREAEEEGGYRTKNKTPTRQCGEQLVHSQFWRNPFSCPLGTKHGALGCPLRWAQEKSNRV